MSLLAGLEASPDFPRNDLSEGNAMLLELMLANSSIVLTGHTNAEKISWVFRAGHAAMRVAIGRIVFDAERAAAFDHGISSYETIAALLSSAPDHCDMFTVNTNALALSSGLTDDKLVDYISTAQQHFATDMPRTSDVVLHSSQRLHPTTASYAVAGAALARQFELDGLR
ncbi:hypothetical protein BH09PAT4_BH09PAT4_04700 [soil metagenome]